MAERIPTLDCLWNDVVFLMAINPHDLLDAFTAVGAVLYKRRFYRINPLSLDTSLISVCIYERNGVSGKYFVPFRVEDMDEYSRMPQKTYDYYREQIAAGLPKLIYAYVPHILYKGCIDVSNTEIIEV